MRECYLLNVRIELLGLCVKKGNRGIKGNERSVSYLKFSFYTLKKAVKGLFLKKFVFKQHSLMNN